MPTPVNTDVDYCQCRHLPLSTLAKVDWYQCRLMPMWTLANIDICPYRLVSLSTYVDVDFCQCNADTGHCRHRLLSTLANIDSCRCRFKSMSTIVIVECHRMEWFRRSVTYSPPVHPFLRQRSYHVENTASRPISEVKQRWVWSVLGWVTAWEHQMLLAFLLPFDRHYLRRRSYMTKYRELVMYLLSPTSKYIAYENNRV